MTVVEKMAKSL